MGANYGITLLLICAGVLSQTDAVSSHCEEHDVTVLATDWSPGRLLKLKLDLSPVWSLPLVMIFKPVAIAYDPVGSRVYWTDLDLKQIRSCDLDGGREQKVVLLDHEAAPYGMAVDASARKLFYTDQTNQRIGITDLDGTNHDDVLLDTEQYQPLDIVLHERKRIFFWSTHKPLPYIARTKYDGTDSEVIVGSGLMTPMGITLDRQNEILYWCDRTAKRIESITTKGTDRKIILNKELDYFDVFFHDGLIFFTDTKQKSVQYVPADGSGQVESVGSSAIGQMARVVVFPASADNKTVTLFGTDWIPGQIIKVTFRQPSVSTLPVSVVTRPVAIDYDPVRNQVYWTDVFLKHVRRANLDGSNETLLARLTSKSTPDGLALDVTLGIVFYTDTGNNIIARMDLDGSNQEIIIGTNLDEPRAIVLDQKKRIFYWTDWGERPYIAVAHYDGTHRRTIVDTRLIWPNGLALDKLNGILYWSDAKTHRIEFITTEGTLRTTLLFEPTAHYFGLFLLDHTLLFTDWNRKAVMSIPCTGGDVTTVSSTYISQAVGLYVIDNTDSSECLSSSAISDRNKASAQKYKPR